MPSDPTAADRLSPRTVHDLKTTLSVAKLHAHILQRRLRRAGAPGADRSLRSLAAIGRAVDEVSARLDALRDEDAMPAGP